MIIPFEWLLVLGVIAFYLYDSTLLLYENEMVFAESRGRWRFLSGSSWQIVGRNTLLPNPLTPQHHLFRVHWDERLSAQATPEHWQPMVRALKPLRVMLLALLTAMLPGLALVVFFFGTGPELLALFAAVYLTIVTMLVVVYRRRAALGLDRKAFVSLCIDSLACAPFALNLVRKISLRCALTDNPVGFAREHFAPDIRNGMLEHLCDYVGREMEMEEPDSARHRQLRETQQQLRAMVS